MSSLSQAKKLMQKQFIAAALQSGADPMGDLVFVDSANGSDGWDGHDPLKPKLTIGGAVAVAGAGDTILARGLTFDEAVVVAVAGLKIIGVGSTTHRCLWDCTTADAVCLTINGVADCVVENIRFRPPAYSSSTPAAISLVAGAYQTAIRGCRFQGKTSSYYGIKSGANANVHIEGCEFQYLNNVTTVNGTAIYTGTADCSGWYLKGNTFESNIINVDAQLRQAMITDNIFCGGGLAAAGTMSATLTTKILDISGAASGYNIVTRNFMGGLYHADGGLYGNGTGDCWSGNHASDRTHTGQVDATTGITITYPS